MRILLVSLQGIGNTILVTPAIKFLYKQGHMLDMVVSDNNSQRIVGALEMLRNIYIYSEKESFLKNALRLRKEIPVNKYDLIYAMCPNGRRENLLSFFLGKNKGAVKDRTGFWSAFRFLLKEKISIDKETHDILNNLKLVGAYDSYQDCKPLIVIPPSIDKEVASKYSYKDKHRPLVATHPTAGLRAKCWGLNKYAHLYERLINEAKAVVVILGSPAERDIIDSLINSIGGKANKFIHENILYAAAVIKQSDIFLGNDSSLMHIAASLEKPTLALWGFTDYKRISPHGSNSIVIKSSLDCIPCYSFEYGYGKKCRQNFDCLKGLDEDNVYEIVSFAIDKLREGKSLESLDFKNFRNTTTVETLWSKCRIISIT